MLCKPLLHSFVTDQHDIDPSLAKQEATTQRYFNLYLHMIQTDS